MILTFILGTRPEVIKMAPLILLAKERGHETNVVFTGQHEKLALPLLRFFGIDVTLNLGVMTHNQSLSSLTAKILEKLGEQSFLLKSDFVVVQGDTNTAFAGAYWAFCSRIRVAHIEAGLRTYDLKEPFPEEANRQLIGRISTLHFAPTEAAKKTLLKEGVAQNAVLNVGNTAIDALFWTLEKLGERGAVLPKEISEFIGTNQLVLVTAHRRESFGAGFESICRALLEIADKNKDVVVLYPVHPNPNVRVPAEKILGSHPRIKLIEPLDYPEFVTVMQRSSVLLTDSGGIQEEGPSLRKPIIVMREKTERPEGVKAGFSKLVGTDQKKIVRETLAALKKGSTVKKKNPYGDGKSAIRILKSLEKKRK